VPKEQGIYEEIETTCQMTLETIAHRVFDNRSKYMAKFEKKKKQQDKYYNE
jgi:hypothetical protein